MVFSWHVRIWAHVKATDCNEAAEIIQELDSKGKVTLTN